MKHIVSSMGTKKQMIIMFAHCLSILALLCSSSNGIESPQYKVMHSDSDIEVRLYRESSWVSAPIRGATSFQRSTKDGFHRLYQYIHGANLNSSQLTLTAPILTSIIQAVHGADYFVRLYLPASLEKSPPQPNPELNLQVEKWGARCVATRKFSGIAKDDNIDKEVKALIVRLSELLNVKRDVMEDKYSFAIAEYDPPSRVSGRVNEVWMNVSAVSGLVTKDCASYHW